MDSGEDGGGDILERQGVAAEEQGAREQGGEAKHIGPLNEWDIL